jgi:hypothetical protein
MNDHVSANYTAIEPGLYCHDLALGHQHAILTARSRVDERTTAAVLHHELVAEDLGYDTFYRDRTSLSHPVDRGWLQQHHAPRRPVLGKPRAACAQRSASDQHDRETARREAATRDEQAAPRRWHCFWFGSIFTIGHDRVSLS